MALISIKSTNPNFSFILQKNPVTPLLVKAVKEGHSFGFYPKDRTDEYVIVFKDGFDTVSYRKNNEVEETEYLNTTRYNSSLFISHAIKDYLSHIETNNYKQSELDVAGFENSVTINMVYVGIDKYLQFFTNSFPEPDYFFKYENVGGKNFKLTISTNKRIHDLINMLSLLSIFLVMINDNEDLFVDDSLVERYLKILNRVDAPYYIRSLFKLKLMTQKTSLFDKFKTELQKTDKYDIKMVYGDTHSQRIKFITNLIDFEKSVIDIGCGEGRYLFKIAPKINQSEYYHAIDVDNDLIEDVKFKIERKEIENVLLYNSFDNFKIENNDVIKSYNIILTEVIEHIPMKECRVLLLDIINFAKDKHGSKLIITTPNSSFNKYYFIDGKFRHDDHKFELNESEFENLIYEIFGKKYHIEFSGVGDSVDNVYSSQAAIITF